ncbi:queuosine precursor transporter [Candidatus Uhrbacteria bacterium]|nr:queuosine precursor transporter [Candidatus Uhrbacteria bacterium]
MRHSFLFVLVTVIYVTSLLLANTVASKLVELGPFIVAGGIIIFPITYIFGDILTEVYGYRESRKIIWLGFFAQLIMVTGYIVVQHLPAPPFWTNQTAYEAILGFVPRIVGASMIAYLCGEFANSVVLSRMKVLMSGKYLWMRTIGSTLVGEGVDTIIFGFAAFGGLFQMNQLWTLILSGYLLKVSYEVIATPLTYAIIRALKRKEQIDVYDTHVDYNPLNLIDA